MVPPGKVVDHLDGDHGNNHMSNLRLVDASMNAFNTIYYGGGGSPFFRGVAHITDVTTEKPWVARWTKTINGKRKRTKRRHSTHKKAYEDRRRFDVENGILGTRWKDESCKAEAEELLRLWNDEGEEEDDDAGE